MNLEFEQIVKQRTFKTCRPKAGILDLIYHTIIPLLISFGLCPGRSYHDGLGRRMVLAGGAGIAVAVWIERD